MVTIPQRGEVGQDARRARGTRFASGTDVPQVSPSVTRDPGLQTSPEQFGAAEGRALEGLGGTVAAAGEAMFEAEQRIRSREDTVDRARMVRQYNEAAASELRRIQTEADLSNPEVLREFGNTLAAKQQEFIQGHQGSEDSRARLTARLEAIRGSFADQAAAASFGAQRALVQEEIGRDLNDLAANVSRDPGMFVSAIESLDGIIDDAAPALTPQEEQTFRRAARGQLVVSAVDSLLMRGGVEEAEEILDQPGIDRFLEPATQTQLQQRISQARESMFGGGEPFTLGPEQIRFDANGRVIAAGAGVQIDDQGRPVVSEDAPQSDLLDDTGAVKRDASGEIRRQAAQMLGGAFDPSTGQVSGLPPERAQAAQQLIAETEAIIERGEENSVGQAVALAATRVDVPDALTFEDIADQAIEATEGQDEVRNLEGAEARLQREQQQAVNVADATGLGSGIINIFNNTVGQLDPTLVDTDVVRARQKLAILEGDFINAFNRNPRLPVWEQIRLSRVFSGPALLRSPESVRAELDNIDNMLTQQIDANKRLLAAPIPNDRKQEILSGMLTMAQFRKRVRDFDVAPAVPSINSAADVSSATPEEVRNFVNRSTTEQLDALPQDVLEAITEKAAGGDTQQEGGGPQPLPTTERNGQIFPDVDRLEAGREYDIGGETFRFNGEVFESVGEPEGGAGGGTQDPLGDQSLLDQTGRVEPSGFVAKLEESGLSREAAIGFAGNIQQESGFDPNTVGDNGNAFGLFQHNGPRAKALFDFAQEQGEDVPELTLSGNKIQEDLEQLVAEGKVPSAETQVAFALHELETTERKAAEAIRNASTPQEAARLISRRFFRPGKPREQNRIRFAQRIAQSLEG